jgi:hypothetical protein
MAGVGASADVGGGSGPPTAIGTGGAAASVERLARLEGFENHADSVAVRLRGRKGSDGP